MLSSPRRRRRRRRRRLPLALDPFSYSLPPPHLGMRSPSRTKATGRSAASSNRSPPRAGEAEGGAADGDLNGWAAVPAVEYADESIMIPKNTSVLIRRKPGRPRMPIVTEPEQAIAAENRVEEIMPSGSAFLGDSSMKYPEESEWDDEFSNSLYVSDSIPSQSASQAIDASSKNQIDEDSKIKALIDTAAVDYRLLNRNMKMKS